MDDEIRPVIVFCSKSSVVFASQSPPTKKATDRAHRFINKYDSIDNVLKLPCIFMV